MPLLADSFLEITPYTEMVVPGALKLHCLISVKAIFFLCESSEAGGCLAAHAAALAHHRKVPRGFYIAS